MSATKKLIQGPLLNPDRIIVLKVAWHCPCGLPNGIIYPPTDKLGNTKGLTPVPALHGGMAPLSEEKEGTFIEFKNVNSKMCLALIKSKS